MIPVLQLVPTRPAGTPPRPAAPLSGGFSVVLAQGGFRPGGTVAGAAPRAAEGRPVDAPVDPTVPFDEAPEAPPQPAAEAAPGGEVDATEPWPVVSAEYPAAEPPADGSAPALSESPPATLAASDNGAAPAPQPERGVIRLPPSDTRSELSVPGPVPAGLTGPGPGNGAAPVPVKVAVTAARVPEAFAGRGPVLSRLPVVAAIRPVAVLEEVAAPNMGGASRGGGPAGVPPQMPLPAAAPSPAAMVDPVPGTPASGAGPADPAPGPRPPDAMAHAVRAVAVAGFPVTREASTQVLAPAGAEPGAASAAAALSRPAGAGPRGAQGPAPDPVGVAAAPGVPAGGPAGGPGLVEPVATDSLAVAPVVPPSGEPGPGARAAPLSAPAALAGQIALAMPAPAGPGQRQGTAEIVLSPAELGRVRIRYEVEQGQPVLYLSVERPETLELMRRNLELLEAALRDLGHSGCNLSLGGHERGGAAPGPDHDPPALAGTPGPASPPPRPQAGSGRLDLRL